MHLISICKQMPGTSPGFYHHVGRIWSNVLVQLEVLRIDLLDKFFALGGMIEKEILRSYQCAESKSIVSSRKLNGKRR
jgi:hypothetical protein